MNEPFKNTQPPEKFDESTDGTVDVQEIFYTIQGEGPLAGRPAVFVRLAGCNFQCPGCDTDYTSKRRRMDPPAVVRKIHKVYSECSNDMPPLVVLSGGEPFRQKLGPLLSYMLDRDTGDAKPVLAVQIETNGALTPDGDTQKAVLDGLRRGTLSIVISPKTATVSDWLVELLYRSGYYLTDDRHPVTLKYVVEHGMQILHNNGAPRKVLDHPLNAAHSNQIWWPMPGNILRHRIYVQPRDVPGDPEATKRNTDFAVMFCMRRGHRLSLQTHKTIGVP